MSQRSLNTPSKLKKAIQLHAMGDLSGAELSYLQVISKDSRNYTALANIGGIYLAQGKWPDAEKYLKNAAKINASNPDLHYKLGVVLHQQGKLEEAIPCYQQAIQLQPNYPEAHSNLGVIYHQQGKLIDAMNAYLQAINFAPNYPDAYYNLGFVFKDQGKIPEAIQAYQKALDIQPNNPIALYNLGIVFQMQGKLEEAITAYQQALDIQPNYVVALYNLGTALQEQGLQEQAIDAYKKAIILQPNYVEAYSNLGLALKEQGKLEESIICYQKALTLRPDFPNAYHNLGLSLYEQGRLEEAITSYQKAISLRPNYAATHMALAIALLHLDYTTFGWQEYEWRFEAKGIDCNIPHIEKWDGTLKDNIDLLLIEEQGMGDVFQFMRYGSLLKEYFPSVSIAVKKELCKLIEMTEIYDQVYPLPLINSGIFKNTKWIPLLSVPAILNLTKGKPLLDSPYIKIDLHKAEHWRKKIHITSGLVVGLNWQGNPVVEKDDFKGRSLQLAEYESLASIPGIQFVSLQKGYGSEQLETCTFQDKFVECQDEINQTWDWVETAAIVQNCDLIITSDTSLAHLAGGMGKATWILLKKIPDWRWGLEGEQCAWYPSARLLRQTENGNWAEVIERIKEELAILAAKNCEAIND